MTELVVTAFFALVGGVLCLGPTAVALWLAAREAGWARAAYATVALAVVLPFALLTVADVLNTVRSYDGSCHHAPDIRYPCSLARAIFEAVVPISPFAQFGYLMVGVASSVWGYLILVPAWLLVGRGRRR